jgi:hypothetical protein
MSENQVQETKSFLGNHGTRIFLCSIKGKPAYLAGLAEWVSSD